ncbi:hypothetical protein EN871_17700 [bacterium M00.F.Ca.ET.228.01.1.1]|nr:hypothetical protein EN871_17700 [bacterium M00.F.Ca.ET.228.01.1.1]TGR98959.1 hypothetical protein EN834_20340 [bacterium M00.F.Ca.ET.191.01.1.1]TGU03273.1 hypothetical protein EN798_21160 [bacterium M00.F.Ca.ET.155.01.1.1]
MGSAAAPGGAGEALVGQTSSSGVRLSDSSSPRAWRCASPSASRCTSHPCFSACVIKHRQFARALAIACNLACFSLPFLTLRCPLFSYTRESVACVCAATTA